MHISELAHPLQIPGNLILIALYGLVLAGSAKLISGELYCDEFGINTAQACGVVPTLGAIWHNGCMVGC